MQMAKIIRNLREYLGLVLIIGSLVILTGLVINDIQNGGLSYQGGCYEIK